MAAVLDYTRSTRRGSSVLNTDPGDLPRQNWNRYEYGKQRGHLEYCEKAKRYEEYYLGGGLQFLPGDREKLENEGRLPVELNEIADAVNTALGYQINNRADISFKPRGQGASEQVGKTLSQVAMQIADNKGAEPPDFVGRFEEVRHHDRHHAGRRCRANAVVGILQRQT